MDMNVKKIQTQTFSNNFPYYQNNYIVVLSRLWCIHGLTHAFINDLPYYKTNHITVLSGTICSHKITCICGHRCTHLTRLYQPFPEYNHDPFFVFRGWFLLIKQQKYSFKKNHIIFLMLQKQPHHFLKIYYALYPAIETSF